MQIPFRAMKILLTALLFLVYNGIGAQHPDSLWADFQNPKLDSISRIKSLHRMVRQFMQNNPDSALVLAQIEYDFAASMQDERWIAFALNSQGGALTMQSQFAQAADKFYRMLDLRIAIGDTIGISTAYNNIGNIYFYQGDYTKALENYIRSLHYEELAGGEGSLGTSYLNIGSVYALQDESYHALQYFTKGLLHYEKDKDTSGIASALTNIGTAYKALDSLDASQSHFLRAIPLLIKVKDDHSLAIAYSNLADVHHRLGDYKTMFAYYAKCEALRHQMNDQLGLAAVWINRGNTYALIGELAKGKEECEKGLQIAESLKSLPEIQNACDCLYQVYKGLKQDTRALAFYERRERLEDSLARDETLMQLQVMEFRKEVARDSLKREEEKAAIDLAHGKQLKSGSKLRNVLALAGLALAALAFMLYRLFYKTRLAKAVIEREKRRADELLLNILPAEIAEELKRKGKVDAQEFQNVTILFTDFVGFTEASERIRPHELVKELNHIYTRFDEIASRHGVEKIKNIGDAYMAAGGLPQASEVTARNTVRTALEMQEFVTKRQQEIKAAGATPFEMRVGIHTGPVVAGIIGVKKFHYDVWGDTVNTANRMETTCKPGHVNISASTYAFIKDDPEFVFEAREKIDVKGKGEMQMYFVALK
jgi:adenylate cyclase